jgi:hypothetical protein
MTVPIRFSVGVWALSSCTDRFCTHGYRDPVSTVHALLRQQDVLSVHELIRSSLFQLDAGV